METHRGTLQIAPSGRVSQRRGLKDEKVPTMKRSGGRGEQLGKSNSMYKGGEGMVEVGGQLGKNGVICKTLNKQKKQGEGRGPRGSLGGG